MAVEAAAARPMVVRMQWGVAAVEAPRPVVVIGVKVQGEEAAVVAAKPVEECSQQWWW